MLRQAEAEGLTLLKSASSNTGYKGVSFHSGKTKPYHAQVCRGGKTVSLGGFATAEEAALCYARIPRGSQRRRWLWRQQQRRQRHRR